MGAFAHLQHQGHWRGRLARLRYAAASVDALADFVARSLFDEPDLQAFTYERLRHNDIGALRRVMLEVVRFDLRPCLASLKAPTLVLAGERDTTVPLDCARELATRLPAAQLHIIPGAGHALPYDQPDRFLEVVLPFLAGA